MLCDIDADIAVRLPAELMDKIGDALVWLHEAPTGEAHKLQRFVEWEGVTYGFVPDMANLTVGEFSDLEYYAKEGFYEKLEYVLAVLYRPVVFEKRGYYEVESYSGTKDRPAMCLDWPMSVALGAMLFFWTTAKALAVDSHSSSTTPLVSLLTPYITSGAGTKSSIH